MMQIRGTRSVVSGSRRPVTQFTYALTQPLVLRFGFKFQIKQERQIAMKNMSPMVGPGKTSEIALARYEAEHNSQSTNPEQIALHMTESFHHSTSFASADTTQDAIILLSDGTYLLRCNSTFDSAEGGSPRLSIRAGAPGSESEVASTGTVADADMKLSVPIMTLYQGSAGDHVEMWVSNSIVDMVSFQFGFYLEVEKIG